MKDRPDDRPAEALFGGVQGQGSEGSAAECSWRRSGWPGQRGRSATIILDGRILSGEIARSAR